MTTAVRSSPRPTARPAGCSCFRQRRCSCTVACAHSVHVRMRGRASAADASTNWGAASMNDDIIASEFKDVDRAADFAVFSSCLDLIDSLPFFAECKRESYGLLGAAPGRRVLDVGCGLGDDAAARAGVVGAGGAGGGCEARGVGGLVGRGGSVGGVDGSDAMIEEARRRHGAVEGLSFDVAN